MLIQMKLNYSPKARTNKLRYCEASWKSLGPNKSNGHGLPLGGRPLGAAASGFPRRLCRLDVVSSWCMGSILQYWSVSLT